MQNQLVESNLFSNIVPGVRWCDACGCYHPRIDAKLPDSTPVVVLSVGDRWCVHVGTMPADGLMITPIHDSQVIPEIMRQWAEVSR